jgi:signal transduction histidine kinase
VDDLIQKYERIRGGSNEGGGIESEFRGMLSAQLLLQSRALLSASQALGTRADLEAKKIRSVEILVDIIVATVVVLVLGAVFMATHRTVLEPLEELSEGARRIGSGDLGYRLPAKRRNEIGAVARNFNAMAGQLALRELEVQEKIRDLDAFCYGMAHNLKAPLRSIAGFSNILEEDYADKLDSVGRQHLLTMRLASIRMGGLIDDLLSFAALAHKEFVLQPIRLDALVRQVIEELDFEIRRVGAKVCYEGTPEVVFGNESILKQVLENLISNGIKFVPSDRTPEVTISTRPTGNRVCVEVQDNGIGIKPEHQARIFGLFERLHTEKEFPGSGVGLAMVAKGIERLGGRLGVRSDYAKGSTFWFELKRFNPLPEEGADEVTELSEGAPVPERAKEHSAR